MAKRQKAFNSYEINKNIAKILILHRIWFGFTQNNISDCLNVSFQQIQKYEKCINRLAAENLIDICKQKNWDLSLFASSNPEVILEEWITHIDIFTLKYQLKIRQIRKMWQTLEIIGEQNYYNEVNPRQKKIIKQMEQVK